MKNINLQEKIDNYKKELELIKKITQLIDKGATGYDLEFSTEQQPNLFQKIFGRTRYIFKKIGNEKIKDYAGRMEHSNFLHNPINELKRKSDHIQEEMGYLEYKIKRLQESDNHSR